MFSVGETRFIKIRENVQMVDKESTSVTTRNDSRNINKHYSTAASMSNILEDSNPSDNVDQKRT